MDLRKKKWNSGKLTPWNLIFWKNFYSFLVKYCTYGLHLVVRSIVNNIWLLFTVLWFFRWLSTFNIKTVSNAKQILLLIPGNAVISLWKCSISIWNCPAHGAISTIWRNSFWICWIIWIGKNSFLKNIVLI